MRRSSCWKLHTEHKNCNSCGGDGQKQKTCDGDGLVTCGVCTGTGQIRYFLLMTRTHKTLVNERVVKDSIPDSDLTGKSIIFAKAVQRPCMGLNYFRLSYGRWSSGKWVIRNFFSLFFTLSFYAYIILSRAWLI